MSLVLVVEDDASILRGLKDILRMQNYRILSAQDGAEGLRVAMENKPDLIILDVALPELNGFQVCRELRGAGFQAPILMLTARGAEADRVKGLDLGADDYVTKPFSVRELLARVRALLRRAETAFTLPNHLNYADVDVDFEKYEARKGGRVAELTRKEFGLLRLLAAKAGAAVSRDDLLNGVWGHGNYPSTRTVDTHISSLRTKLEDDPANPKHLITVHGVGYKFTLS